MECRTRTLLVLTAALLNAAMVVEGHLHNVRVVQEFLQKGPLYQESPNVDVSWMRSNNLTSKMPRMTMMMDVDNDTEPGICDTYGIESDTCRMQCNLYMNVPYLISHLNESNLTQFVEQRFMSSGVYTAYYQGIYDMCEYVSGRFCSVPLVSGGSYVLQKHGCCIPNACHGEDAEKVLKNTHCYQGYERWVSGLLGFNASDPNDPSGFTIPILCETPERDWDDAGVVLMLLWIGMFALCVFLASLYRQWQYDRNIGNDGEQEFVLIASEEDSKGELLNAESRIIHDKERSIRVVRLWGQPIGYVNRETSDQTDSSKLMRRQEMEAKDAEIVKNDQSYLTLFVNTFCVQESYRALTTLRPQINDEYPFFDGLRFLSTAWVILGHAYVYQYSMGPNNAWTISPSTANSPSHKEFTYEVNRFYTTFALQGLYSVDTFFWLSGFLATKSLLKMWPKFGFKNWWAFVILAIIVRYLRFIPMVVFATLCEWKFLDLFPFGPALLNRHYWNDVCSNDWTKIFFFYANFTDAGYTDCMGHLWYLNVDLQLFATLPFLIMLYSYNRMYGISLSMIGWLCAICCRFGLSDYYHLYYQIFVYNDIETKHDGNLMTDLYNQPYTRCGPYYAAACLYLIIDWMHSLFGNNDEPSHPNHHGGPSDIRTSKMRNFVLSRKIYWLLIGLSSALLLILFISPFQDVHKAPEHRWNYVNNLWYNGFDRPIWGLALSLLTFALRFNEPLDHDLRRLGHGSLIKRLLTGPFYQVLGKLTFVCYLIHFPIYGWYTSDLEQSFHLSTFSVTFLWLGIWVTASTFTLGLFFLMERPLQSMISLFLSKCLMPLIGGSRRRP